MKVGTGITSMKFTLVCFILAGVTTTQLAATDEEIKITDAVQKLIVLDEKLAQVGKAMGKNFEVAETITKFLAALGPAFDAVSVLFPLVSILSKPDSQELQPIKDLEKQMDMRFDRIDEQLNQLDDLIRELSDNEPIRKIAYSFKEKYLQVKVLEMLSMEFLTYPTQRRKNDFIETCEAFGSRYFVSWIEMRLKPGLTPPDTLLYGPHVFKYLKYENVKWEAWVDCFLNAAVCTSFLHIQCMNVTGDVSSTELEQEKDKFTKNLSAIAEGFKDATRDFYDGFKPFPKKATKSSLSNQSGSSKFKAN